MTTTGASALPPTPTPNSAPTPTPTPAVATERPVPRWADRVAHAIPLVMLPVCLWRLPFAFGHSMGLQEEGRVFTSLWQSIPYIFGLSLLSEMVALLSFALVRGWGEVVPSWVPRLGGRRIRPAAVLVPATLLSLLAWVLLTNWTVTTFGLFGLDDGTFSNGSLALLARVVSGLFVLWAPLLTALTWAYYVRRCRTA
ncbi:hypothetical protein [Streptomyces sp. NPDC051211]|uniref:hypothetical protein n=1 Tax=Streptomyces sp. NPDC051211 TaxID=3154643 RepID=UPI00344CFF02